MRSEYYDASGIVLMSLRGGAKSILQAAVGSKNDFRSCVFKELSRKSPNHNILAFECFTLLLQRKLAVIDVESRTDYFANIGSVNLEVQEP